MANQFFAPGDQRAMKVNSLFERIAPRYDLINDLQSFGLHRCWKRRLVNLSGARPGTTALDVCCGTGDLALALARRGSDVVGLDFSPRMLAIALQRSQIENRKSKIENSTALRFLQGDALHLPFPADSFDIVTIGYGLRNLADCEAGLREMQRVLKPGGRVLVLDFGKPDNALWRAVYFGYLRSVVPLFGLAFCGDPATHSYILESLRHYPAQRGVAASMDKLGLANVRIVNLLAGATSINCAEKRASN